MPAQPSYILVFLIGMMAGATFQFILSWLIISYLKREQRKRYEERMKRLQSPEYKKEIIKSILN